MMAWRYCGMRLMRFTRPFSRPPTARRKMTCAMSGRPSSAARAAPRAGMALVGAAIRCSASPPVRAAAPRIFMGSILQAGGDRRLHRRKEFAHHCAGGCLLITEIGVYDDRRCIAGLDKQLGFALP